MATAGDGEHNFDGGNILPQWSRRVVKIPDLSCLGGGGGGGSGSGHRWCPACERARAGGGGSVCAVLGVAAVVVALRRAPAVCCALACAAPGATYASVGWGLVGSSPGWLNNDNLLQAEVFGIFVIGCLLWPESCGSKLQVTFFLAIFVLTARQKSTGSLSNAPMLKVGWSMIWFSLLFPSRRNRTWFVIQVELGPPAQFRLTGLMLEFLRFNDESRGDSLPSPVTHIPKSTAQQPTSVFCRSRGGSRWGLTVCQAECTSNEAQATHARRNLKIISSDLVHACTLVQSYVATVAILQKALPLGGVKQKQSSGLPETKTVLLVKEKEKALPLGGVKQKQSSGLPETKTVLLVKEKEKVKRKNDKQR
uniref:DUF3778 domain-containing protein n=1 Tax=Oryza meridionalis TaxID=40149 RepID=A0A0E0EYZ8_9ORYZ